MWRSPLGRAVLASLLLHALLLALLWWVRPAAPAPVGEPNPVEPLWVEVHAAPAPANAPSPAGAPAPAPQRVKGPSPQRMKAPSPPPRARALAPPPAAQAQAQPPQAQAPQAQAPQAQDRPEALPFSDVPRATPGLLPLALAPEGWSVPPSAGGPGGQTLRPGDASLSPQVLAAQEEARVTGRVRGFMEDQLAELRVETGLVHPYFGQVRASLEKQLVDAPLFDTPSTLHHMVRSYRQEASRYGATGNPGGAVPHAPLLSERLQGRTRDEESLERLRASTQAGERLQEFAEGRRETGLVVHLELRQSAGGVLRSARVVRVSGNAAYDAFVLERVPGALTALAPPPPEALGGRAEELRTLWEVEGRVVYLRKLSEMEGEDAWYTAAMAAAGLLAGRFEETTGEVQVIDLRNPHFVCRPRLLRVY